MSNMIYIPKTKRKNCITKLNIKLRPLQKKAINYLNKHNSLLMVFQTGVGKTITALVASQCYLEKNPTHNVVVISPVSVLKNFHKEMKRFYNSEINEEKYSFFSYAKFLNMDKKQKTTNICSKTMLIIDEAHNLRSGKKSKQALAALNCSKYADKIILLTATPIVNNIKDLGILISLLSRSGDILSPKLVTPDTIIDYLNHKLIYYRDVDLGPDFPKIIQHEEIIYMTKKEYKKYLEIINRTFTNPSTFFHAYRKTVNIIGDNQYFGSKIKKMFELLRKNNQIVIFSNWLEYGIDIIVKLLKQKKLSFGVITGKISSKDRDKIVKTYNNKTIQILLISKAGSEGISLRETGQLFILDPVWNPAALQQIIGRTSRFKSHSKLPIKQRKVDVYFLIISEPKNYQSFSTPMKSGDVILYNILKNKQHEEEQSYRILKSLSI